MCLGSTDIRHHVQNDLLQRITRHRLVQRLVVPAKQQSLHPTALREWLVPPVVQMHGKDILQRAVEPSALLNAVPVRPTPVHTVRDKRVWDAVVQPTRERIGEAKGEDLERRD